LLWVNRSCIHGGSGRPLKRYRCPEWGWRRRDDVHHIVVLPCGRLGPIRLTYLGGVDLSRWTRMRTAATPPETLDVVDAVVATVRAA